MLLSVEYSILWSTNPSNWIQNCQFTLHFWLFVVLLPFLDMCYYIYMHTYIYIFSLPQDCTTIFVMTYCVTSHCVSQLDNKIKSWYYIESGYPFFKNNLPLWHLINSADNWSNQLNLTNSRVEMTTRICLPGFCLFVLT